VRTKLTKYHIMIFIKHTT